MDYVKKRLSNTEARGIANELLKAFEILYNAVTMKLTTSIQGGHQDITRVYYDQGKRIEPRVEAGIVNYGDSDEWHLDNVYKLFWNKCSEYIGMCSSQRFEVTLYSSPEDCGYYSLLPNYDELAYVFCIIQEKDIHGKIKREMCFGFDSEKRTFLELFDIDFHSKDGNIYRAEDSIESELKGRFVF